MSLTLGGESSVLMEPGSLEYRKAVRRLYGDAVTLGDPPPPRGKTLEPGLGSTRARQVREGPAKPLPIDELHIRRVANGFVVAEGADGRGPIMYRSWVAINRIELGDLVSLLMERHEGNQEAAT